MKRKRNKTKIFQLKILIFLLCIIIISFLIKGAFSKFESAASAVGSLSTAMYVVAEGYETMTLNLDEIYPRSAPYEYSFTVSNFKGLNRAEVNLEYDLKIVTTTNLPLTYELYLNGNNLVNIIETDIISADEYGTYFRTLTTEKETFGFTEDETNSYKLLIYFPENYKNIKYQDVIEGIEVQVNSSQIIED